MKYADKVFILLPDGSEVPLVDWQKDHGYTGAQISKYFKLTESKFMQNIEDYGKLVVCELLMKVADKYRDMKSAPVHVNGFNRDRAKQLSLIKNGFRAATVSPHEFFLAMDADTATEQETRLNAAMVKEAAKSLGIKVRIGFEEYLKAGQTFIHFDVCPEYFGKDKPWFHVKHPMQWEGENTW